MTAAPVQPPMTYFGGKTRLARRIAALLPRHEHYVEPSAAASPSCSQRRVWRPCRTSMATS